MQLAATGDPITQMVNETSTYLSFCKLPIQDAINGMVYIGVRSNHLCLIKSHPSLTQKTFDGDCLAFVHFIWKKTVTIIYITYPM